VTSVIETEIKAVVPRLICDDNYTLTNWFCPACGKKTVWTEDGEGDFYRGPTTVCSSCGGSMCWPETGSDQDNKPDSLVSQLKRFTPDDRK
jgi:hypothetical protein